MTVTLPNRQQVGVKLFYVSSEHNSGQQYAVQHIRRNGTDRWFCNCADFTFRKLARKRWCKHIKLAASRRAN